MTYMYRDDRENMDSSGFDSLLDELQTGDCMVVQRFSGAAKNAKGFLALMAELEDRGIRFRSVEEGFDTGTEQGRYAVNIMKMVSRLDGDYHREKQREGINNAKEEGKYKGRKPIEVDEDTFDSILERWKNGEITARQAMNALNLKPNTFYRRVKERMTESKSGEAIWDAAKQIGEEITQAAEKYAAEVDTAAVMDQIGKGISAAGSVLSRHVESLSKDFQEAMDNYNQASKAAPEEPMDAETEEIIDNDPKEWI